MGGFAFLVWGALGVLKAAVRFVERLGELGERCSALLTPDAADDFQPRRTGSPAVLEPRKAHSRAHQRLRDSIDERKYQRHEARLERARSLINADPLQCSFLIERNS